MDKLRFRNASKSILSSITATLNDAGCNGPYGDPETPYRRLAHILKLAAYWERENDFKIPKDVEVCVEVLLKAFESTVNLPARLSVKKDSVNGVIGPAWIIEGLGAYNSVLKSGPVEDAISNLINSHTYLTGNLVWNRVSVDGQQLGPDLTYNHQIWFNEMVLRYSKSNIMRQVAVDSLVLLLKKLKVYEQSGVICHLSPILVASNMAKDYRYVKHYLSGQRAYYKSYRTLVEKSIGYHSFNLCSLVRSALSHPKISVSFNNCIKGKLNKSHWGQNYFQVNLESQFGNSYNPVYAELGQYAIYTSDAILHQKLKNLYFSNEYVNFDFTTTHDYTTREARIYEYVDYFSLLENQALI